MVNNQDGGDFAPVCKVLGKVCAEGDFPISVIGLDHGHIYGIVGNMLEAGANLLWVWDRNPEKIIEFQKAFPTVKVADCAQKIYGCSKTKMILSSIIANERWQIGEQALRHGKHYMSDKTGFTELKQLDVARKLTLETGYKWSICFSERLQVESAIYAGYLLQQGAIGRIIQVVNIAPHRLAVKTRPAWFFNKKQYGGILCDIGSHQIDQMLFYTGSDKGQVVYSQVGNFANPQHPELEDFGDFTLQLNSGSVGYCRLDWFTPEALRTWGDGRLFILGTEGYIEARKYINVGISQNPDSLYLVNNQVQKVIDCRHKVGFPYFGQLIKDCMEGTDKALPQEHVFEVSRLAIEAEQKAVRLSGFSEGTSVRLD